VFPFTELGLGKTHVAPLPPCMRFEGRKGRIRGNRGQGKFTGEFRDKRENALEGSYVMMIQGFFLERASHEGSDPAHLPLPPLERWGRVTVDQVPHPPFYFSLIFVFFPRFFNFRLM